MKMTCKNTLLMAILISPYALSAQLVATTTASPPLTPTSLVQQSLVGTGVTVSNVTTNIPLGADPRQFAEFTNANTILPLGNGIMLSTGYADDYNNIGNNDPGFTSTDTSFCIGGGICGPGDSDLDAIASPFTTNDVAVLEFDFVPMFDTIYFRYVFASEEYPEFVCDIYNDVFAFYLSGPGILGTKNVAVIPGTNPPVPVAINTVNPGTPGGFNTANPNCMPPNGSLAYSSYYIGNTTSTNFQFDGLTTVLDVIEPVISGATYHIKLAIGDAGDGSFDSAVFLEKNSLRSSGKITSVSKIEEQTIFEVYQNPLSDLVQIKQVDNQELTITLLDNVGRIVLTKTSYDVVTEINLQNLSKGLYYLNLNNGDKSETHKILR